MVVVVVVAGRLLLPGRLTLVLIRLRGSSALTLGLLVNPSRLGVVVMILEAVDLMSGRGLFGDWYFCRCFGTCVTLGLESSAVPSVGATFCSWIGDSGARNLLLIWFWGWLKFGDLMNPYSMSSLLTDGASVVVSGDTVVVVILAVWTIVFGWVLRFDDWIRTKPSPFQWEE